MIQSINLMPAELQRRRFLMDRAKVWGVILIVTCGALAASAASLRMKTRSLRRQLSSDESMARRLADASSAVDAIKVRRASFRAKQSVLHRLTASRGWDLLAVRVADVAGDGIWLQELHVSPLRLTGAPATNTSKSENDGEQKPGGVSGQSAVTMTLSGFAVSNTEFAAFMARLNRCPYVLSAQPVQVRTGRLLDGTLVEFSVKCNIASTPSPNPNPTTSRASTDTRRPGHRGSRAFVLAMGVKP